MQALNIIIFRIMAVALAVKLRTFLFFMQFECVCTLISTLTSRIA